MIALIITIIILVILAAISIRAVYEMGIVRYAVEGTQNYAEQSVKENEVLDTTGELMQSVVNKLEKIQSGESSSGTTGATTYTVTFKDGETTLSTETVNEGGTVTKPADPTKEGYDFVNWYSDLELTTEYEFTSAINEDTTIYAKWTETTYTAYSIGDEVIVGTGADAQHFYVLEASGTTESTVTVLAKYNLNKTPNGSEHYMQLANAANEDTACRFSQDKYWVTKWNEYYGDQSGWQWDQSVFGSVWTLEDSYLK